MREGKGEKEQGTAEAGGTRESGGDRAESGLGDASGQWVCCCRGCSDGSVDRLGEKLIWCSLDPPEFFPDLTKTKVYSMERKGIAHVFLVSISIIY
jgi:hypothetical protein